MHHGGITAIKHDIGVLLKYPTSRDNGSGAHPRGSFVLEVIAARLTGIGRLRLRYGFYRAKTVLAARLLPFRLPLLMRAIELFRVCFKRFLGVIRAVLSNSPWCPFAISCWIHGVRSESLTPSSGFYTRVSVGRGRRVPALCQIVVAPPRAKFF